MRRLGVLCPALLLACAPAASDPAPRSPRAASPATPAVSHPAEEPARPSRSETPVVPDEQPPADPARTEPAPPQFPPDDLSPPHARSAAPGDGAWKPLPSAGSSSAVMAVTTLHPHEVSRFLSVTIAAIDLSRAELHFMPGTGDPNVGQLSSIDVGRVPDAAQPRLLAVFNGGFQATHGRWGMMLGGKVLVPPREPGCTLAIHDDDRVELRSWPALAGATLAAYRQTPPCLLENGKLHAQLEAGNEKPWGGFNAKLKTRRRSAAGISADGRVLFYALGEEVGPKLLAEALRHAGATSAAELDINWNWTRFLTYEPSDDGELRSVPLVEGMVHTKSGYLRRPSDRDFFFVTAKELGDDAARRPQ